MNIAILSTGQFRSNLQIGGPAEGFHLSIQESRTTCGARMVIKKGVSGMVILQSIRSGIILEVNSTLYFEGLENYSSIDIYKCIMNDIKWNKH